MFQIHLWLGLSVGVYFTVMGLTGSLLVFADPIDTFLNPQLLAVEPVGEVRPFGEILGAFREQYPEAPISRVAISDEPGHAVQFWIGTWSSSLRQIYVNPYTAEFIGERYMTESLIGWMRYFHFNLYGGEIGWIVNGSLGLVTLVILVTGLILWWPRTVKLLKQRLWVKWQAPANRLNWDLHNAGGAWTLPMMVLIVFTGSYFTFAGPITSAVTAIVGPRSEPTKFDAGEAPQTPPTIDQMIAVAQEASPDGRLFYLNAPDNSERPLLALFWHPGTGKNWRLYDSVSVDRTTGRVVSVRRPTTAADYVIHAMFPLHTGGFGGMVTRCVYVVLGLVPLGLMFTGTWMWWARQLRKKKSKAAAKARVQQIPEVRPEVVVG